MEPLFRAVVHGCAAGRYQEVMDEVYWRRIHRGNESHILQKLGAFAASLGALARLFEEPWSRPHPSLSKARQARVLGWVGFHLRALGRLVEAVAPMEAGLARQVQQEDWKDASIDAANLSELLLALGRLEPAEARAREAVAHADRSGDWFERMGDRTAHADALHQRGRLEAAQALFGEAERMQADREPKYPLLYSLGAYRYGDLLLSLGQPTEAGGAPSGWRCEMAEIREHRLLDIALDHLLLGRAAADLADFTPAAPHLDAAVTGLRKAGTQHHLPRGLLARAALYRLTHRFDLAHRDLTEAHTIATRGGMRLHLCDYHLESARLHLAQDHLDLARDHYAVAHAEVHAMGYHRRDPELAELAAALGPPRSA
jgi:tetratricopeptide (TPR) repeat protein